MDEDMKDKTEELCIKIKNLLNGIDTKLDFNNKVDEMYYYQNNCVSVYDMQTVVKTRTNGQISYIASCEKEILPLIKRYKISDDCNCYLFLESGDRLSFILEDYMYNNSEYKVYKKDDKLYIEEVPGGNFPHTNKVIGKLEEYLSKIYDELMIYKCYEYNLFYKIPSVNSDFIVKFKKDGYSRLSISYSENFNLKICYAPFGCCYYLEGDPNIKKYIEGNEWKILKNTFVRIKDCPYFMQEDLYKIKNDKINDSLDSYKIDNKFKVLSKRFIDFFNKR